MPTGAQSRRHRGGRGCVLFDVLEHVLAQHEVTLAGPRAQRRRFGQELARDGHARLVAEPLLERVRTSVLGLDQQ